jgi:hypothetical protein
VLNTREQFLEDLHPEILSIKHNLCKNYWDSNQT